jgi:hypothetical protein
MSSLAAALRAESSSVVTGSLPSFPLLLTLAETSKLLRVSVRLLTDMGRRGELRLLNIRRRVLVPRAEAERLLKNGTPKGPVWEK